MAQESRSTLLVSCPETVTLHRAMSCVTPHLTTPSTGAPSLSPTLSSSHVLHPPLSEHKSCGDLRPHLSGALAEPRPFTFEGIIGKQVSDGLSDQTRLSILSWNVGPRRGKVTNSVVGSFHVDSSRRDRVALPRDRKKMLRNNSTSTRVPISSSCSTKILLNMVT